MTSITTLPSLAVSLLLVCYVSWPACAQDAEESDYAQKIEQLSHRRFQVRQLAFEQLVADGNQAVRAIESAAEHGDLERARRCVEVLAKIATDNKHRQPALRSLERLGMRGSFAGSTLAKKRLFELLETDQEKAIRLLKEAGARLSQSSRTKDIRYVSGISRDREVALLPKLKSLRMVTLSGLQVTDKCFQHLAKIPQLESVTLMRCSVSDAGLAELRKLSRLKRIGLFGDSFSADGLKHLDDVRTLESVAIYAAVGIEELQVLGGLTVRSLYLSKVEMSDGVAEILAAMTGLRSLHVTLSGIRNEDLSWVAKSKLSSLSLSIEDSPEFNDEGLGSLRMDGLRTLRLRRTAITDNGIATIAGIESLSSLTISDAPITDKGLLQLAALKKLRTLSLQATQVSEDAIESLKQALPTLRYVRNNNRVVPMPRPAKKPNAAQPEAPNPGAPAPKSQPPELNGVPIKPIAAGHV